MRKAQKAARVGRKRRAAGRTGSTASCTQLIRAVKALLNRFDVIHADPRYERVWRVAQLHLGPYKGPMYITQRRAVERALATAEGRDPV